MRDPGNEVDLCRSEVTCDHTLPPLYSDAVKEGMIHLLVGSQVSSEVNVGEVFTANKKRGGIMGSVFVSVEPTSVLKNGPRLKNQVRLQYVLSVNCPRLVFR